MFLINTVIIAKTPTLSSSFEAGSTKPEVGKEFMQTTEGGTMYVVDNPLKDAINSSNKVLKFALSPGSKRRAEYHNATSTRLQTEEMTHFYKWKVFYPKNFLEGADIRWLLHSQWKTWPCEYYGTGDYYYQDVICFKGGINNDLEHTESGELDFRFRANPDCDHIYYKYPRGEWVEYLLEIYWTNSSNGYYKLFVNNTLISERSNVKTLIDRFPKDGSCNIYWSVGLYSGWYSTGADSISYYVDDINIYEKRNGFELSDVCPECVCADIEITGIVANSEKDQNNGSIEVSITNQDYVSDSYWADGSTSTTRNNLSPGNYTFIVIDNKNCEISKTFTIKEDSIYINEININNGIINTTFGATNSCSKVSYTITDLNNAAIYASSTLVESGFNFDMINECPDCDDKTYTLTINCGNLTDSKSFQYTNPYRCDNFAANGIIKHSDKGLDNGTINLSISGGTEPYLFSWSDGSAIQNRINLKPGIYTVSISDSKNCELTKSFEIKEDSLFIKDIIIQEGNINTTFGSTNTCNEVFYSITDINGLDIYKSTTTVSSGFNFNMKSECPDCDENNYVLNINCGNLSDSQSFYYSPPNNCENFIATGTVTPSGYKENNGTITLIVNGGTEPYSFQWNDNSTKKDRINLIPNEYSVSISDNKSCNIQLNFTVGEKEPVLELIKYYPNPSKELVAIEYNSPVQTLIQISVTDEFGNEIISSNSTAEVGKNKITINLSTDKNGNTIENGKYKITLSSSISGFSVNIVKR